MTATATLQKIILITLLYQITSFHHYPNTPPHRSGGPTYQKTHSRPFITPPLYNADDLDSSPPDLGDWREFRNNLISITTTEEVGEGEVGKKPWNEYVGAPNMKKLEEQVGEGERSEE